MTGSGRDLFLFSTVSAMPGMYRKSSICAFLNEQMLKVQFR